MIKENQINEIMKHPLMIWLKIYWIVDMTVKCRNQVAWYLHERAREESDLHIVQLKVMYVEMLSNLTCGRSAILMIIQKTKCYSTIF